MGEPHKVNYHPTTCETVWGGSLVDASNEKAKRAPEGYNRVGT